MSKKYKTPKVSTNPHRSRKRADLGTVLPCSSKKSATFSSTVFERENSDYLRFCFGIADLDGPWSPRLLTQDQSKMLWKKLSELEQHRCGEAFKPGRLYSSYGDMSGCPNKEALQRLSDNYETLDSMGRFRLGGKERIIGCRFGNEFHIIGVDFDHQVWPSKKKNT
ncbi:hypothetical protein JOD55_000406 [Arcanobacterium pluranimalium]|uniref:hypothetical protein n=1 Tax=Arcanobacterium pluranimalium TaxID=108028 RepID=UPI00195E7474|nr:hypothetical protein [Arcanobacterium pluranimalium]MBM7824579.1 hypothetical protein [Arcanobacterium pluranimalium]